MSTTSTRLSGSGKGADRSPGPSATGLGPKSAKAAPEGLRRFYQPGVLERGLKIVAKAQDEAAAKKDALAPEAEPDDAARATHEDLSRFDRAYSCWLRALANTKDPDIAADVDYGPIRAAKRDLFVIKASDLDQVLTKLTVLEFDLVEGQISGPMNDSVLLIGLASVKQDSRI